MNIMKSLFLILTILSLFISCTKEKEVFTIDDKTTLAQSIEMNSYQINEAIVALKDSTYNISNYDIYNMNVIDIDKCSDNSISLVMYLICDTIHIVIAIEDIIISGKAYNVEISKIEKFGEININKNSFNSPIEIEGSISKKKSYSRLSVDNPEYNINIQLNTEINNTPLKIKIYKVSAN